MKISQEYGSELNAVVIARRKARETGAPWYAVECRYGWIETDRKPSLRYGRVIELHPDGTKHHA